jgi:hypothetical protein
MNEQIRLLEVELNALLRPRLLPVVPYCVPRFAHNLMADYAVCLQWELVGDKPHAVAAGTVRNSVSYTHVSTVSQFNGSASKAAAFAICMVVCLLLKDKRG